MLKMPSQEFQAESNRLRMRMFEVAKKAGGGHLGGSFSVIDVLFFLYAEVLNIDSNDSRNPTRDRLILSKGHSCLALYVCLEKFGFIASDEALTFLEEDSRLAGHSEHFHIDSIEITTGSLGHGLGVAAGIALAAKKMGATWRTFCILGDGECNEGSVWETLMFIAQHNLNNIVTIIDANKQESLDWTKNILSIDPISEKVRAFGLNPIEIDGHSFVEIQSAFQKASASNQPTVIIANTIKGKGVDFMEGSMKWHYRAPSDDEFKLGIEQLSK
jgi:transketolase